MGFRFRRNTKVGPGRVTLSRRGLSGSIGAGGVRIGRAVAARTGRSPCSAPACRGSATAAGAGDPLAVGVRSGLGFDEVSEGVAVGVLAHEARVDDGGDFGGERCHAAVRADRRPIDVRLARVAHRQMMTGHGHAVPVGMANKRCRHHGTPGRTLHLIDIENLVRGSGASASEVVEALAAYRSTVAVRSGDHVVIASGRRLLIPAGLAWPGARLLLGAGVDGADRALLEACVPAAVAVAYDRVVFGSGDGIFAARAPELHRAGLVVAVVSLVGSLAIDLRDKAALVRRFPAKLVA